MFFCDKCPIFDCPDYFPGAYCCYEDGDDFESFPGEYGGYDDDDEDYY